MAMIVVNRFKVVDIDHQAGKFVTVPLCPAVLNLESFKKSPAIQTTGQGILSRKYL
jgi:hypothetical protein